MIKNYLKISIRNLCKNKLHTFINIFGLGVAIAVCILGYVNYQFSQSYDTFHEHGDFIYSILSNRLVDGHTSVWSEIPMSLGPQAQENIPGIEAFTRVEWWHGTLRFQDKAFNERFFFVDPAFLGMLSYPLLKGNSKSLTNHNDIVISEDVANKYFGEEDPIGKQVTMSLNNHDYYDFKVSAVISNAPNNTVFKYSILLPFQRVQDIKKKDINNWTDRTEVCLIQLRDDISVPELEKQLQFFLPQTNLPNPNWQVERYFLEPFSQIAYMEDTIYGGEPYSGGMHPAAIITPSIIALFVLVLACFNFVNIAISSSARRLKEIGIRKTIGALRRQLIIQFLGENIIVCLMALVVGLALGDLFVSVYDQLWPEISLVMNFSKDGTFLLFLFGVIMATAILAGLYPAIYISHFSPVNILKGKNKLANNNLMFKISLTTQFVLVIINLMAAIVMGRNVNYFKTMDPGFRIHDIIQVPIHDPALYQVFKNAIQYHHDILSVSGTQSNLGYAPHYMDAEVENQKARVWRYHVGIDYLNTMGVNILSGRNFNERIQSDQEVSIIVNKNFCKLFGLDSPIGKYISLYPDNNRQTYQIIGVINDFHVRDIDSPVEPVVLVNIPATQYSSMAIHFKEDQFKPVMAYLKQTWQEYFPHLPFLGYSLDEIRENEVRVANAGATVFSYISFIVIIIIAMGLFALIALNVEKRTKEIAVRTILGASLKHISKILIREFVALFFISLAIAASLGTYLLSLMMGSIWTEYTGLDVLPVVFAASIIIAVATITLGIHLLRIRGENPVEALRYE